MYIINVPVVVMISAIPYSDVVNMFVYSGTMRNDRIFVPKELIANSAVFFVKFLYFSCIIKLLHLSTFGFCNKQQSRIEQQTMRRPNPSDGFFPVHPLKNREIILSSTTFVVLSNTIDMTSVITKDTATNTIGVSGMFGINACNTMNGILCKIKILKVCAPMNFNMRLSNLKKHKNQTTAITKHTEEKFMMASTYLSLYVAKRKIATTIIDTIFSWLKIL